jgi:hypothetical protein
MNTDFLQARRPAELQKSAILSDPALGSNFDSHVHTRSIETEGVL